MKKLLFIMLSGLSLTVFFGCDSGLKIKKIEIYKYPDRIVYYIGKDIELDLSGCELLLTTKSGTTNIQRLDDAYDRDFYTIEENINFHKAGVYKIVISRHIANCSFAIEVIDLEKMIS